MSASRNRLSKTLPLASVARGALLALPLLVPLPAAGQSGPDGVAAQTENAAGAAVDIARREAQRRIGRPLALDVKHMREIDGWMFILSELRGPDGALLDYGGTYLEGAAKEGGASHVFCALLERREEKWVVAATCLGATDVAWEDWDRRFGAPSALFDLPRP